MSTSSVDLRNLPSQLDVAALMRQVMATDPAEEEIDAALRRTIEQEYPDAEEGLFTILREMLAAQQRMLGITRREAIMRVAQAKSEMKLSPEGKPEITSFQVQTQGLEDLPAEQREQILEQIETAMRTGRPIPKQLIISPQQRPRGSPLLLLIALVLGLAGIYSLAFILGRG